MHPDRIRTLSLSVADVGPKTRWIFLDLETEAGLRGCGEATLPGRESEVSAAMERLAPIVFAGASLPEPVTAPAGPSLPDAAARSAISQALWCIEAQRRGLPLADTLGTARRADTPVYGNINRRTTDRSPARFAAGARDAVAAGQEWLKIAPSDEATEEARRLGTLDTAVEPGLKRIAAVRDAIGPRSRLMVDCHWRLDEAVADHVISASAELGVYWVECLLPETDATIDALSRLRRLANRYGVKLAGMELGVGCEGFLPFVRRGVYDVMMPEVKYVGSLDELMLVSEMLRKAGVAFSPHYPTGPVCHAISLHLCAVVPALESLETQFDETPLFAALGGGDLQHVTSGCMQLPPGPGAGITLQQDVLERCRSMHWTVARDGNEHTHTRRKQWTS